MRGLKAGIPAFVGLILLLTAFSFGGCSTDECYDNKNALPYAGFYGRIDSVMKSVTVDSLEVYGVGAPGDSVLSNGDKAESSLYLPFRIDSDTTVYVFRVLKEPLKSLGIADTVTFIYDREARFVSSACGASYLFRMRDIRWSGVLIDSVVCPDMEISNADKENLRIYFHTWEEQTENIKRKGGGK